jgi:hypothetical protein
VAAHVWLNKSRILAVDELWQRLLGFGPSLLLAPWFRIGSP